MTQNGKGDLPRPMNITVLEFGDNWKRTFERRYQDTAEDGVNHDAAKYCPPLDKPFPWENNQ